MYNVYLDGDLVNSDDIINISSLLNITIEREGGISTTEQILREKITSEISFCGSVYLYICNKLKENTCNVLTVEIEDTESTLFFKGLLPLNTAVLNVSNNTGKASIRDMSYSAYLNDYSDVATSLHFTTSKNCMQLNGVGTFIDMKKTYNNDVDVRSVFGFDVLDVLNYLVSYYSDNNLYVVSDFLTTNKYFITTGFNMHSAGVRVPEIYPSISINNLFTELRKKLKIYMGVEYNTNGNQYIRIEHEDYFYSNTIPLLNYNEIPNNTVQSYDLDGEFNSIIVGSDGTDLTDDGVEYYPSDYIDGWEQGALIGCGTCSARKSNELNLKSDYIIDSNVIYEALNITTADYDRNEDIFLVNYTNDGTNVYGNRTLVSGEYHYNDTLRNTNVVQGWISYFNRCIALGRNSKYGFRAINGGFNTGQDDYILKNVNTCTHTYPVVGYLGCYIELYDLMNSHTSFFNPTNNACYSSGKSSQFVCQEDGLYKFHASSRVRAVIDAPTHTTTLLESNVFEVSFVVFSDDTLTTIIDNTTPVVLNYAMTIGDPAPTFDFDITSHYFNLSVGNVVMVKISDVSIQGLGGMVYVAIRFFDSVFELIADSISECNNIQLNEQDTKPFILEFNDFLCYNDFALMRQNKNGYINVMNNKYWIKELNYKHNGLSSFKLVGNTTFCGC